MFNTVEQGWPTCGACGTSGALDGSWWRIAVGETISDEKCSTTYI